jgi:hypothetical protein
VENADRRRLISQFIEQGIVVLPNFFSGDRLKRLQNEFRVIAGAGGDPDQYGKISYSSAGLARSPELSRAAVDKNLLQFVWSYWGKPVVLAQSSGLRIESFQSNSEDALKGWHHDNKRKQVKIMVLLTNVPEDGQRMDYLPGTQRIWHQSCTHEASRFIPEEVRKFGTPIRCAGPAGTVVIFDTNGIHRPNRNSGPSRDVWVFNYTAGRHIFEMKGLCSEVVDELDFSQREVARLAGKWKGLKIC